MNEKRVMNEKREWINTIISLLMLIAMLVGLFIVNDININLKEINAEKVSTQEIFILSSNGTATGSIYSKDDGLAIRGGG